MELKKSPYVRLTKKGNFLNKEKHFIKNESGVGRKKEIIRNTINSIYEISSKIKDIELVITKINTNSRRISVISNIINDISTQTHILALNTSIELARAEKQEDGFSIIANEIKNLTKHSEISAKDIGRSMEPRRQDSTEAIANEVTIDDGIVLLRNTGQTFDKTIRHINDLEKKIKALDIELRTELSEYLTIAIDNIINITKKIEFSLKKEEYSPLIIKALNKIDIIKGQVVTAINDVESNHLNNCNNKIAAILRKQLKELNNINMIENFDFLNNI